MLRQIKHSGLLPDQVGVFQLPSPSAGNNRGVRSAGLEEEDGDLTEVEVDEVLGLVRHVAAEVAADDGVPSRVVLLVELLLDVGGDVLLDVELLQSLRPGFDCVLLHVLRHVSVLDYGLALRHRQFGDSFRSEENTNAKQK
mgnify:CR=1 FL=1